MSLKQTGSLVQVLLFGGIAASFVLLDFDGGIFRWLPKTSNEHDLASTQRDLILRRLERLSERVDSLDRAMQKIATIVEGAELKKSLKVSTLSSTAAPDQTHKLDAPISADDVGERTIHFMYGLWDDASKPMPGVFNTNMATWKRLNPGWTVKLWHLKDIKELWKTKFPELAYIWAKLRPIQRADLGRLLIVYTHGGLYADLDTAPTRAVDDIFQVGGFRFLQHNTILCVEDIKTDAEMATSARWAIRKGIPELRTRIANYVFWAKPGSPTIGRAIALAKERLDSTPETAYHVQGRPDLRNPYAIIYTTGPDVITEATFPRDSDGRAASAPDNDVLILPEDKCHMNNMATGTWIGDNAKATEVSNPR